MNLIRERLEILRALSHDRETIATCDSHLRSLISKEIVKIARSETENRRLILEALVNMYKDFDLAVIRAILVNAHLFRQILDIQEVIQPLFAEVLNEIISEQNQTAKNHRIDVLLHEVEKFSLSPQGSTKDVLDALISELLQDEKAIVSLLKNANIRDSIRIKAADVCVNRKLVAGYDSLIGFAEEVSKVVLEEDYQQRVVPLLLVLNEMGTAGLDRLINSFNEGRLGRHGAKLLAEFGDKFASWFLSSGLKPSPKWVNPLWQTTGFVKNSKLRNELARILCDEWTLDVVTREEVIKIIREKRAIYRNTYLQAFDKNLRDKISNLVGSAPITIDPIIWSNAATGDSNGWNLFIQNVDAEMADALKLADLFTVVGDTGRYRILDWVTKVTNNRFMRKFVERLLKPKEFEKISPALQHYLVGHNRFKRNVQVGSIENLLATASLDEQVVKQLNSVAQELRSSNR